MKKVLSIILTLVMITSMFTGLSVNVNAVASQCPNNPSGTGHEADTTTLVWVDGTNHKYNCINCGKTITEKHELTYIQLDEGGHEKYCEICEGSREDRCEYKIVSSTKSTCTAKGKETYQCKYCKHKYTKSLPMLAHQYGGKVISKATLKKNGSVYAKCKTCGKKKSKSTIYYPKTIKLSKTKYTYDGKVKKPAVTVKDSKGNTISSKNYSLSYSKGRKNIGKYTVKVKFKGNYTGTKTLTFKIYPKPTSISSVSKTKNSITVKFKKQKKAYVTQVQYSTSSKFKNAKTFNVRDGKTSKKLTGLKANTTYYVRVRVYKEVKGTKYHSSWTKAKKVKTNPSKANKKGSKKNTSKKTKKTPTKPSNLKVTVAFPKEIRIKFKESKYCTGYEIEWATNSKFTNKQKNELRTSYISKYSNNKYDWRTYNLSSLKKNTKYYIRVRAFYSKYDTAGYAVGKKIYSGWTTISTKTPKKTSYTVLVKGKLKIRDADGLYVFNEGVKWNNDIPSKPAIQYVQEPLYDEAKHQANLSSYQETKYIKKLYSVYKEIGLGSMNDDCEKVYAIAMWLGSNVEYDYDIAYVDAYTALFNGKTVCHGYAQLTNDLCYLADVPCYYLVDKSINHALNLIQLHGYWYEVDNTSASFVRNVNSTFSNFSDCGYDRMFEIWIKHGRFRYGDDGNNRLDEDYQILYTNITVPHANEKTWGELMNDFHTAHDKFYNS